MKIKLAKLLEIYDNLKRYSTTSCDVIFKFSYVKNLKTLERFLEPYREALKESIQPSKDFLEFEKERQNLIMKYAELDHKGNIKTDETGNAIIISNQREKFNKAMKKLVNKHKHLIEERNKQIEKYNEVLEQEVELPSDLIPIPLSIIPGDIPMYVLENMMDIDLIKMDISLEEKIEDLNS